MKQKIYIVGLVNLLLIFSGAIFKVNHWPAAAIMLTLGLSSLVLITIPLALISHYKAGNNQQSLLLHLVTWLTCFVVFTAMLFKIMHWPYAGLALTIALPFPYIVFLPVFIAVTSRNRNFNIYNTVFVLLLLALNSVFSLLLSLNVTKQRISDSYSLARNFNMVEMALEKIPGLADQSTVSIKIDQVIRTVDEYELLLLKEDGITIDQWKRDPEFLSIPDSRQAAVKVLFNAENPVGRKLENELRSLVADMEKEPGYKDLAAVAPVLFDVTDPENGESGWTYRNFVGPTLSWSLIYLDGLKADLLMIKAAGKQ
jgi:hypothetical protein